MRNTGKCPKCGRTDVIRIPGRIGPYGTGNNIPTGMTVFTSVKVTRYLCGKCGFSEEWITGLSDLQKLREKYPHTVTHEPSEEADELQKTLENLERDAKQGE